MAKNKKKTTWKACLAVIFFAIAAILSAVTAGKVAINYNLADYLGSDTQTKIALEIIDENFGATGTIQVMAKNVTQNTAEDMLDKIEAVPHVLNVNFDKYDETYYKDGNALFIVIIDGDDYSENAKQAAADIKSALSAYDDTEYGGTAIEKQSLQDSITNEMNSILIISLCLVAGILLITSESWLEPLILLAASGVAVLINRGTNIFFGEISYITNSISAILQLALSVDYSIVLLHTYRREKEKAENNGDAMRAAVKSVIKPVSASALTTVAGLLALLFMSFKIGFDIGIVLMKGIVISAVISVTLLPALVLLLDTPMKKAHKKAFVPKGKGFCKTAFKASKAIVPIALVLVIVCGVLQTGNTFVFTDTKAGNAAISEVFGNNNSVVAVYKNSADNDENEQKLADALYAYRTKDGKSVLTNYTAYSNTVKETYDTTKVVQKLEISEQDAKLLFTMYNLYREPASEQMTFAELTDFSALLLNTDEDAKAFVDDDAVKTITTLKAAADITAGTFASGELYEKLTTGAMEGSGIGYFQVKQLYGMYFYDTLENDTIDFRTALSFIIAAAENENLSGMITAETAAQLQSLSDGIEQYEAYYPESDALRQVIDAAYPYERFLPVLSQVAAALTGSEPQIAATDEAIQQIYILYFYQTGMLQTGKLGGATFARYALSAYESNGVVHAQLSDENRASLADLLTIRKYCDDSALLTYETAYEKLSALQSEIESGGAGAALEKDKISGIYVKYAIYRDDGLTTPVTACDLLDFVGGNMDSNLLLKQKMNEENRRKVADAQADIQKATDLFVSERYSRMLLSVNLPNESDDTREFVDYLSEEVRNIFGDGAYITGEIVSTCDLEKSFDHDNTFITIFTLVSIFVIVMLIFRSLSLPVILVAVIQGAIFEAMSTQLFSDGIFFMSYIVTTCILMGATIDYGILMSSNYVAFRETYDKRKALEASVETAMPTVFTSGLILTVCGFVIHFISSQNSIATVGLLIGIGTICSMAMITIALPSVLYLLDKFVLKFSLKKKKD